MIQKYIRGNNNLSEKVLSTLEDLGGRNRHLLDGDCEDCVYYIDDENIIQCVGMYSRTMEARAVYNYIVNDCEWKEIDITVEPEVEYKPFQHVWGVGGDGKEYPEIFLYKEDDRYVCTRCSYKQIRPYEEESKE